ncbi:unnamed protein product [Euphydryas editha]|uniref:Uncharacterized protein n=1 Tax=Euphydryas editha TaxID=104508 RepID=A0AAU9V6F4_EUPED|nr:unnamed protein product [Euphydryas editha]
MLVVADSQKRSARCGGGGGPASESVAHEHDAALRCAGGCERCKELLTKLMQIRKDRLRLISFRGHPHVSSASDVRYQLTYVEYHIPDHDRPRILVL